MEHAPQNAMTEAGEVERFRDRCSELMAALLDELARTPDEPRTFPDVERALSWPRRRIASVLGGVFHLRQTEFAGRRPYRFSVRASPVRGAGRSGSTRPRRRPFGRASD